MRKEAKMKRENFFLFWKKRKNQKYFLFFCCDFQKPSASTKKPNFWLFILCLLFNKLFFCFQK